MCLLKAAHPTQSRVVQVRSPKVAPRPPQSDVQDVCWDCYGTVYGKVTSGTASLHGQDGTVRQVAPTTSEHSGE